MSKAKRPATKTLKEELAEFETPSESEADRIKALQEAGYLVIKPAPASNETHKISRSLDKGKRLKLAVCGDTHFGSKYQQLTHLRDFYAFADSQKVEAFLHVGDIVDGDKVYRGQEYEVFKHGFDAQVQYAVDEYPKSRRKGVITYLLSGNHDDFKQSGGDAARAVAAERDDIEHTGRYGAYLKFHNLSIYMMHPHGSASYARTYRPQKIVEQFASDSKPHVLLAGHWHVSSHLNAYRNVEAFQVPCFQQQTPFLRRLGLQPVVGAFILDLGITSEGLGTIKTEWRNYYKTIPDDY